MKVAVCISGALRTFSECARFIQSFFGNVDYYGCFWAEDRDNLAPDSPESFLPFRALIYPNQPIFSHKGAGVELPGSALILQNPTTLPMYLGIQMSFDLLLQTVSSISYYDIVFRCRPDLWLKGQLTEFLPMMTEAKVYFPNHSNYYGYCDQFAGGAPQLMQHLFKTYQEIPTYNGPKRILNPETFLKFCLDRHRVAVAQLPFEFKIYRPAFFDKRYEDIPRQSVGFRAKDKF